MSAVTDRELPPSDEERRRDREFQMPSDEERATDHELIAAVDAHESIGERYARTGEVPVATSDRQPAMDVSPGATMERDPTPVKPIPTPPRFLGRLAVRTLIAVIALVAIYFLVTLWQVWSTGRADQARPVDAIVVLGAAQYDGRPSPQLEARLEHAFALWEAEHAPTVIVTGGNRPGDRTTEADTSATYLIGRGVPDAAIVREREGTSTYESLAAARALAPGVTSVLVVTDPYHALRSRMVAAEVGFEAYVSPADESVVTGAGELRRELDETFGVAVGRLVGFDTLDGWTN